MERMKSEKSGINVVMEKIEKVEQGIKDYNTKKAKKQALPHFTEIDMDFEAEEELLKLPTLS